MNSLGSHVQNDKTKPHLLKDLKENLKKLPLNAENKSNCKEMVQSYLNGMNGGDDYNMISQTRRYNGHHQNQNVNDQYQGKCTDSFYPGLNKSIRYVYLI